MLTIQLYFKEFKVKFKTALNSLSFWNEHPNNIHTSIESIHLPTFHFYSQCICQGFLDSRIRYDGIENYRSIFDFRDNETRSN